MKAHSIAPSKVVPTPMISAFISYTNKTKQLIASSSMPKTISASNNV